MAAAYHHGLEFAELANAEAAAAQAAWLALIAEREVLQAEPGGSDFGAPGEPDQTVLL